MTIDILRLADFIGQNYGYDVDQGIERLLTEKEIIEIHRILWKKYSIKNCLIETFNCSTCYEYDPLRPIHMDVRWLLSDKQIEEVELILDGIVPDYDSSIRKEAYLFYNLFERVLLGLERNSNFMVVKKSFLDSILDLNIEELNNFILTNNSRLDIIEDFEWEEKCELLCNREFDNYFIYEI